MRRAFPTAARNGRRQGGTTILRAFILALPIAAAQIVSSGPSKPLIRYAAERRVRIARDRVRTDQAFRYLRPTSATVRVLRHLGMIAKRPDRDGR